MFIWKNLSENLFNGDGALSLLTVNGHLLRVNEVFYFLLENFTFLNRLSVFVNQSRVNFVHRGALAVWFVFSVIFKMVWEQLCEIAILFEDPIISNAL